MVYSSVYSSPPKVKQSYSVFENEGIFLAVV